MSYRRCHRIWIGCCALSAALSLNSSAHGRQGVELNGPIELNVEEHAAAGGGAGGVNSLPPLDLAAPPPAQTLLMQNISLLSKPEQAGPPIPTSSSNEGRQLGSIEQSQSLRTDQGDAEHGDALGAFDPRNNEVLRVIGALGAVIGLLLVAKKVLRKAGVLQGGAGRPSGVLEILARYPVGRGQQLILLKLARRVVLLHQSGSNMISLSEMSDPDEVAGLLSRMEAGATERGAARFRNTLNEFMAQHEDETRTSPRLLSHEFSMVDAEVVDLTRSQSRGLMAIWRRGGSR